jgi:hypothetical protein
MTPEFRNALNHAVEVVTGRRADTYDADALYGALLDAGVVVLDIDSTEGGRGWPMAERCDFECDTCH